MYQSFTDVWNHVSDLIDHAQYNHALNILQTHLDIFPTHQYLNYYLRMHTYGHSGQKEALINCFKEAMERNFYYEVGWFQNEPFDSFQSELQPLVEESAAWLKTIRRTSQPQLFVTPAPAPNLPLLIALHGNNSNANEVLTHWGVAAWLLAAPQSSAWSQPNSYVWLGFDNPKIELEQHFSTLQRDYTFDNTQVVLAGYSMGANVALRAALFGTLPVRGFILVAPFLMDLDDLTAAIDIRKTDLRAVIMAGENDPFTPNHAQKLVTLLETTGLPHQFELHGDGLSHAYPKTFSESLRQAMAFILG